MDDLMKLKKVELVDLCKKQAEEIGRLKQLMDFKADPTKIKVDAALWHKINERKTKLFKENEELKKENKNLMVNIIDLAQKIANYAFRKDGKAPNSNTTT